MAHHFSRFLSLHNSNPNPWSHPPSGGGKPPGGPGKNGGKNTPPPDIEDLLKRGREGMRGMFGGGKGDAFSVITIAIVALLIWLASGVYMVDTEEEGVVLRLGEYHRVAMPGLNYRLPYPIERVEIVPVERINTVEVGVRTGGTRRGERARKVYEESLMLTGDENIVDVDFVVQWKIKSAADYLFKVFDPENTVKTLAESAMRAVIGRTDIAGALTEQRSAIEQEARNIIQERLDFYQAGIEVARLQLRPVELPEPVIDAFRDVQNAKTDKESEINRAEAYRNDILPRARGEAARIVEEAEAYREAVISHAKGEADRFLSIYEKYKGAEEVTKQRLYLETMEAVLQGTDKILLDSSGGGTGVLPYLPLPELKRRQGGNE